jgi:glutamine amidotransferase
MFSFTGFATRAEEHKDGFGIAFFEDKGVRLFVDSHSARESPVAEMVRRYPIRSQNIVAHIRKATQGRVALENTHPFVRELWGRYWVFAHNGDLKGFAPRLHGAFRPVGATDSERAFCWLMQELAKAHAGVPGIAETSTTLAELLPQVARHGVFNAMLSNDRRWGRTRPAASHRPPAPVRPRLAAGLTTSARGLRRAHLAARPIRQWSYRAADQDETWSAFAPGGSGPSSTARRSCGHELGWGSGWARRHCPCPWPRRSNGRP